MCYHGGGTLLCPCTHACISSIFFRTRFPAQLDLHASLVRTIAHQSLSMRPLLLRVTCTSVYWPNLLLETSPSAVSATKVLN